MKPPPFSYFDPTTVAEAIALLGSLENAKLLAGGQSLMPMLNMRFVLPDAIVDLNKIGELSFIRRGLGGLEIGAMTRQRDIEFSSDVRADCPILIEAIGHIGHRQTRNRGTLGGSLCHLDPAAELVTIATALDAVVAVDGPRGTRHVDFSEFPGGYMSPAIGLDEIVTGVRFPVWPRTHGYAFAEFARRHGDFALASAAVLIELDSGSRIEKAAIAIGGVGAVPLRMSEMEAAVVGRAVSENLFTQTAKLCASIEVMQDVHVPASYRRHLATVLSVRALRLACARAQARPAS